MYVTIRWYERVAGSVDDIARAARELAANLSHTPGFVSYALVDAGNGAFASVSVFERQDDLLGADPLVTRWTSLGAAGLLSPAPESASGEVIAQKGI
jgi:hypothetical protein